MKSFFEQFDFIGFWEKVLNWIMTTLPVIVLILIIGLIGLRIWTVFVRKTGKILRERAYRLSDEDKEEAGKRVDTLMGIVRVTGKLTIWGIIIMLLLQKLEINIGPLLAGLGILGLAVGFGAQELVRDVVTGFFMLLENQIRKGDVAIINGTGGLVESVSLRTVTLRDLSGVVHIFQNGKINSLSNMTKEWSAMIFDVGVAYKEDTDKVVEVMKKVGENLQQDPEFKNYIINPLEIFGVDKFDESAVIIKARLKTKPIQQWLVGREFNRRLKIAFDKEGIEIPFPHRTIYWGEGAEKIDLKK